MHRSLHALLRRAAAGVAALAILPLAAAPASAAQLTVPDGDGDMWRLIGDQEFTAAPHVIDGDIVRTGYSHTDTRVVVKAKFVELKPTGYNFAFLARTRAPDGKKRLIYLNATRRHRGGTVTLLRETEGGGQEIECRIRHKIHYDRNTLRIGFPRTCLGNPRWLQFNTWSVRSRGPNTFFDAANSPNAPLHRVWTAKARSG